MGHSMGSRVGHSMRHSGETSSGKAASESTTFRRCALPVLESGLALIMHSANVSCISAHLAQQSGNLKLLVSNFVAMSDSHEPVPPERANGGLGACHVASSRHSLRQLGQPLRGTTTSCRAPC